MRIEVPRTLGRRSMTHGHYCEFGKHTWICSPPDPRDFGTWSPPICICPTHHAAMDQGDHSVCPLGSLACPEHHLDQINQGSQREPLNLIDALSVEKTLSEELVFEEKNRFINEVVFAGLTNLNTGFDSPSLFHVSPEQFGAVIDRCEFLGVCIIGIETFEIETWPTAQFVTCLDSEGLGNDCFNGARKKIKKYLDKDDLSVSAVFRVPLATLMARGYCLELNAHK